MEIYSTVLLDLDEVENIEVRVGKNDKGSTKVVLMIEIDKDTTEMVDIGMSEKTAKALMKMIKKGLKEMK